MIWKQTVRRLKQDVTALVLASRDPRVPWVARALAVCIAAYALSPIDLIPDVIPVLGLLDDLILLPLGIWLVIRLIPPDLLAEHRTRAADLFAHRRPISRVGAVAIVCIWVLGALILLHLFWPLGTHLFGSNPL